MLRLGVVTAGRRAPALLLHRADSSTAATQQQDLAGVRPFEEIPGPKPLPFVGNTWRFIPGIGEFGKIDFNAMQSVLYNKYGKIVKLSGIPGRKDMVYLFDPKDVETAFRNEGPWPIRDAIKTVPYYRGVLRKDFFKGIEGAAFTGGKQWQDFRSKVNQTMMQPRNTKLYVRPIDEVTNDFIERMRCLKNKRGELPANFIQDLNRWSLESISLIALDTRLGCLDPELKPDSEPEKMINAVHVMFEALYELDAKPSLIHFTRKKLWRELVKCLDLFNEVAMKYIQQSMDRIQTSAADGERDLSVLESLLLKNDDPMVACVMALDMMLAGVDTTSHSSATALHFLARNQDKQEKLFRELKEILPSKYKPITAKELSEMKYLKACIKESMRISPTTSANAREAIKDVVVSNYHVPKGTDLVMALRWMSNQEEHFPQPERFIPERWLKGDELQHTAHPFAILPFGFGPRMCLGRRFAELEIETLVAKVIRNFRLEYNEELKLQVSVINMVTSPLSFKMEDRE